MKVFRDEKGQMLVFTALTMTALLGFLALATDVGTLFRAKRQLQIAADAAATAATMDLLYGQTDAQATADADDAAANNGATTASGAVVTVHMPPQSGFHQSTGYVEVFITQPNPTFFTKLFGVRSMSIAARAVAGTPGYATNCIFLMDPTGYDFKVQGSETINAPGCGIYDNSTNTQSVLSASGTGGGLTINAPYVTTVGGGPTSLGGAPIYTNAAPESPPPLQSVGADPSTACTTSNTLTKTSYAGTSINGSSYGNVVCFSGANVDITNAQLSNGVFLFENGVTAGNTGGNTSVTNGTIDVHGGAFTQNSNSSLSITAPTGGTFGGLSYNAVALLVPVANTTYTNAPCASSQPGNGTTAGVLQVQWGSNGQTFEGYIVAPNADVYLQDNGGGGVTYSGIYAACLFGKSSTINIPSYNVENPNTTPLQTVALVE